MAFVFLIIVFFIDQYSVCVCGGGGVSNKHCLLSFFFCCLDDILVLFLSNSRSCNGEIFNVHSFFCSFFGIFFSAKKFNAKFNKLAVTLTIETFRDRKRMFEGRYCR